MGWPCSQDSGLSPEPTEAPSGARGVRAKANRVRLSRASSLLCAQPGSPSGSRSVCVFPLGLGLPGTAFLEPAWEFFGGSDARLLFESSARPRTPRTGLHEEALRSSKTPAKVAEFSHLKTNNGILSPGSPRWAAVQALSPRVQRHSQQ